MTDVAGPLRETNVGRNALLSASTAAQVDELAEGAPGAHASGGGTVKGGYKAHDDSLRLILSLHSVTNYTGPILIAFVLKPSSFIIRVKIITFAPKFYFFLYLFSAWNDK